MVFKIKILSLLSEQSEGNKYYAKILKLSFILIYFLSRTNDHKATTEKY
jgi:hypothetical protein